MPGGRRSFTTVDVQPFYDAGQRLRPPEHLGQIEKQAFIDLVARVPAAQFVEADLPLICRWCECQVMAERAAAELQQSMVKGDKVSPWFTIHQQATKTLKDLSLRLRLAPQSRLQKAPKSQPTPMTAYERLALEDDDDDESAQPS
jgi:phage terminase small subunit